MPGTNTHLTAPDNAHSSAPASALALPLELLERLAAANPDDPLIHRKCGELYFATRHMDLAIKSFSHALLLAPGDALAHYALACTWQALGKTSEAERSYRAALTFQPDMVGALFNLGLLLRQELGRAAEAIPFLLTLLDVDPHHVEVHRSLGAAYFVTNQIDAAIASYRRYVAFRPDAAIGHYELGCALSQLQCYREAIPYFETSILLDAHFADAYLKLGNALLNTEGFAQAYPHYCRAHVLRPLIKRAAAINPATFSVLVLFAPGAANTPLDYLVGHADYNLYITQILPDADYDPGLLNSCADVVLNLVSDVDQGRDMLAIVKTLVNKLNIPVINSPDNILLTDRQSTSERLSHIPHCRVPVARRYYGAELLTPTTDSLSFPFLIRRAGTHNGDSFEKVDTASELRHCISKPEAEYYAIEYIDYQSRDGYFRKYRFIFVNQEIYPYHLAIGKNWKVHHGTTDMAEHPWMQQEEEAFLENPESVFYSEHFTVLENIRKIFGLDFFGIDCGLDRDGNLVVFEVNATMLIHQHNAQFPYKIPHVQRIKTAFDAMLKDKTHTQPNAAA